MTVARDALGPGPLRLAAAAGMTILLAGCGTAPKESFYTLSAAPPAETVAAAAASVHVGPVSIPEAVDRNPMVIAPGRTRWTSTTCIAGPSRSRPRSRA